MMILRICVLTYFLTIEQQHGTTNQSLLKMAQKYKGNDDIEVEKIRHKQSFYNLVDEKRRKNVLTNIIAEEKYLKVTQVF